VLLKDPKNIEEEYFNPSIRSVLGEGAHQPLSTGKVLTQIGEFEIVNEGAPDATGDIKAATPQFSECQQVEARVCFSVSTTANVPCRGHGRAQAWN
jgi:hypothetical protein